MPSFRVSNIFIKLLFFFFFFLEGGNIWELQFGARNVDRKDIFSKSGWQSDVEFLAHK